MVGVIDRVPEALDCVSSAVTAQCGQETGDHIAQLGARVNAACHEAESEKRQRGNLHCIYIVTDSVSKNVLLLRVVHSVYSLSEITELHCLDSSFLSI